MGVTVNLANGNIGGLVATTDGIAGIVMTGATEGNVTAGTPFVVRNATEITALGLTVGNNPLAFNILDQIAKETANLGVNSFELYVLVTASTLKVNQMADITNANGAKKLVDYAAGRIKNICVVSNDDVVYPSGTGLTITAGINADCSTAITNLHALCNSYAAVQWPMRGIVALTSFNGTAADLANQTSNTKNRIRAFIGNVDAAGKYSAVGLLVARRMCLPVQRKVSRVRDGSLAVTSLYINTTSADQYTGTSTIASKGIITIGKVPLKAGYFFTDDVTCVATTDDYHVGPRGNVIDKAHVIAYLTFVEEQDDEVPVEADGKIDAGYAKTLETRIEQQINLSMVANGEASAVTAFVDTNQNVLQTSQVNVVLRITPVGYAKDIVISLGFGTN